MQNIINRIQRPQTAFGKNIRDLFLFSLATGALAFFKGVDAIDFGAYDAIVTSVVGFIAVVLNRVTRK